MPRSIRSLAALARLAPAGLVAASLVGAVACRDVPGGPREQGVAILWRRPIEPDYQWHGRPAVADGRVFFDVRDGITAVDERTGATLWHTPLPGRARPFPSTRVLLERGGLLIAPDEEATYALDAATGSIRWQVRVDTALSLSNAAADDRAVYVGTKGRLAVALAVNDGSRLWAVDVGPDWLAGTVVGLAVSGDTVYAAAMRRTTSAPVPAAVVVVALDRRDGRELWRYQTPIEEDHTTFCEPVVAGDLLLVSDEGARAVVALDRFTGAARWASYTNPEYGGPGEAAVVDGGTVYFGAWDSFVYAVDLATGSPRWEASAGNSVDGLVVCRGRVFARNQGADVFDARTGAHVAEVVAGSDDFLTSAFVASDERVFASGTQALYALRC